MYALSNRAVALFLCLIMILGGSLLGVASSMGALREQSEEVFVSSGMQQDLADLSGQCANVQTVASRHLPADDRDLAEAAAKKAALDDVMWSGSAKEKYTAAAELMAATDALHNRLQRLKGETAHNDAGLSDDVDLATGAWAAAVNAKTLLARGPYNEEAAYYNLMLGKLPTRLFANLTGLKPLELYA